MAADRYTENNNGRSMDNEAGEMGLWMPPAVCRTFQAGKGGRNWFQTELTGTVNHLAMCTDVHVSLHVCWKQWASWQQMHTYPVSMSILEHYTEWEIYF